MTAEELTALSASLTTATANVENITDQAIMRGMIADVEGQELVAAIHKRKFDYMAPLPDLNIRQQRSWEPAARHYRDLTEEEKASNE